MSDAMIDSLSIEISSSSDKAAKGIDALCASLDKLEQSTAKMSGLQALSNNLNSLTHVVDTLGSTASTLSAIGDALNKFKDLGNIKIPTGFTQQVTDIVNAIGGIDADGVVWLGLLGERLKEFGSIGSISIPSDFGKNLSNIVDAMKKFDFSTGLNSGMLVSKLSQLSELSNIKIPSSLGKQLNNLVSALKSTESVQNMDLTIFTNLATALQPLSELGRATNLSSTLTQLKKLPEIAQSLAQVDMDSFTDAIQKLNTALSPLSETMSKVSSGFSKFPQNVQKAASSMSSMSTSGQKMIRSFTDIYTALKTFMTIMKTVGKYLADWIGKSNEYIESVNLFTASLGEYAAQAQEYAEKVGEVVGIDPSDWMNAQGIFYNLADGFGVASDRAYIMSQQLTQLSYDLASFYNLDVDEAMLKVRGGLSGEIEMMRQLGVDLSNAAMQERATAMGIQTKVTAMTQAEKAQLRYQIMMERTTTAQGDMARTLNAPANQLRVLSAQCSQAARALGNVFIPILNTILPVAIAAAKAVRILAASIASLFGYELPSVDYSSISSSLGSAASSAGDLSDGLGSAGSNAKKLKSTLMGFDELNVLDLSNNSGGGGGGGGSSGGGGSDGFDFDLTTYDFLGDAVANRVDQLMKKFEPVLTWVQEHLEGILAVVSAIGVALLEWKIARTLIPDLSTTGTWLRSLLSIALAVGTIVVTATLSYKFANDFMEDKNFGSLVAQGLTTAAGTFITTRVIAKQFGKSAGRFATGTTLAITAFTTISAIGAHVVNNGIDKEAIIEEVVAVIEGAAAGGFIAAGAGLSVIGGAAVGAAITLTAGVLVMLAGAEVKQKRKLVVWGPIALEAAEISAVVDRMFTLDTTVTVDLIDSQISDQETVTKDLNEKVATFQAGINKVLIGVAIDEDEAANLINQITGEGGIIETLNKSLSEGTETINLAVTLVSPKTSEGEDQGAALVKSMGITDDIISGAGTEIGSRLVSAIQQGMTTGFSQGEDVVVAEMTAWLARITTESQKAGALAGFQYDITELLTNVDRDSFSTVIDEYFARESEYEESLRELDKQAYVTAQQKRASLQTALEYYQSTGNTEMVRQTQEALETVDDLLENWDTEASIAAAMQEAAPQGRKMIMDAFREMFSDPLSGVIDSDWWSLELSDLVSSDSLSVEDIAANLEYALDQGLRTSLSDEDYEVAMNLKASAGLTNWDLFTTDMQNQLFQSVADAIGDSKAKEVFAQMGYYTVDMLADGIGKGNIEIKSAADGMITLVGTEIGEKTIEITPELEQKLSELGIDLNDSLTEGLETGTDETLTTVEQSGTTLGTTYGESALEGVESTVGDGSSTVTDALDGVQSEADSVTGEIADNTNTAVSDMTEVTSEELNEVVGSVETQLDGAMVSVQTSLGSLATWVTTNVTEPISDAFATLASSIRTTWLGGKWYAIGKTCARLMVSGIKAISLPKFSITWNSNKSTVKIGNTTQTVDIPTPTIRLYKSGGFPSTGELFVANENGKQEMVGRIGSKPAVANQDQIGDAIFQYMDAHAEANNMSPDELATTLVRAIKASGLGATYLDGKQLARSINRETQRTGKPAIQF